MTLPLRSDEIPSDAWHLLASTMTEDRQQRMLKAAESRTRHFRLVIQDIHNPHNVSACMRSAEAFGVQDVDVVTLRAPKFRPSTAARGVEHWLTVRKHQSVEQCARELKEAGYLLAAGVPKTQAIPMHHIPIDKPVAILFGNEHKGLDLGWRPFIDLPFTIPMVGMVESLNISVSAAITLQTLTHKARCQLPPSLYFLSEDHKKTILNEWACLHVANWQGVLARLRQSATT